ncbi:MAG: LuxR C-terminal-related transcriptional regulator [Actinomycetota bacterium]
MRVPEESVLVEAKLRRPQAVTTVVARPAAVARLCDAPPEALRLIVAPAGWGKSQLVAQWLAACGDPAAYLAVDRSDRDPTRFWFHLLQSIGRCGVDVEDLVQATRAPGLPLVAEIVEPLAARLEQKRITVVIEDLHLVSSADVLESVEALVDTCPHSTTLGLVSRTEPPIHLPRRRVNGALVEVGPDDLRMNAPDTRLLLTTTVGTDVGSAIGDALAERTEGWPAGIYLAGLSLRGSTDPAAFVDRFAGADRMIADYLSTEVLANLDDRRRRFLTRTAVLDQLDGPTCDELLEIEGSARELDGIVRTNLFLIPLDAHGRSHRYHQLFRDRLLADLDEREPGLRLRLHRRAADIALARGDVRTAVDQAMAAGDHRFALRVANRAASQLLFDGAVATLAYWVDAIELPDQDGPRLGRAMLRAWIAITEGDVDAVHHWCSAAERHLERLDQDDSGRRFAADLPLLTGYAHLLAGDFTAAKSDVEKVLSTELANPSHAARAWIRGAAAYWLGGAGDHIEVFQETKELAGVAGDTLALILADGYLADARLESGDRDGAEASVEAAFRTAENAGLENFGHLAMAHMARARLHLESGRTERAAADAERAVELSDRRGDRPVEVLANLVLAQAKHTGGDAAAAESLRSARAVMASLPETGFLAGRARVVERQLRLPPAPGVTPSLDAPVEPLTDREVALLRLLPGTLSQRELGQALNVSFNTVKTHNRQIYRKLGVTSRDDAVAAARRFGLL